MKNKPIKTKTKKKVLKLNSKIKAGVFVGLNLSAGSGRVVTES